MELFNRLVEHGVEKGFTDIHITGGHPVVFRSHGQIVFDRKTVTSHGDVDRLVSQLLTPRQLELLRSRWSVDFALSRNRVRLRINVFCTTRGLSLAVRLLPGTIPSIENLNLHPSLKGLAQTRSGLILISGTTGSGKSTTIASLINEINQTRGVHVVTMEDPVEYRFSSDKAFIEQRELGAHIPSFEQGLIDVLREDPDVIVLGELREPESIRLALNAAESGHLVIASMHGSNMEDSIYRICNSFPLEVQEFVRFQLSSALVAMVVQQLTYLERARFRVPVLAILHSTQAVRGLIRENRITQLESTMHMSRNEGMFTLQQYMSEYLNNVPSFVPPSRIFRPTVESAPDTTYESPLLHPGPERLRQEYVPSGPATVPASPKTGPSIQVERQAPEDSVEEEIFGKSYRITDEMDVKDVVRDLG